MSDLISRQAAIDAVEESRRLNHHQDGKDACAHEYEHRHFLKILIDLPPAYPKKGKWAEHVDDRWGASHYFCSECGEKPLKEERTNRRCLSNFCPNCGARMDEV